MRKILYSAAILLTVAAVNASHDCRFAPDFTTEQLLSNHTARLAFQDKVLQHEANFIRELGIDAETGLTVGRIPLNKRTGMPRLDEASKKSSLKNEAVHIAIIGKALLGGEGAT